MRALAVAIGAGLLLAGLLLVLATPVGASAAPVRVPGWNATNEQAVAVDRLGRGVLLFNHGEQVWAASISPAGRLVSVARIPAGRAVEYANDLSIAMNDRGEVVAAWSAFNGEMPRGRLGYGFLIRPWTVRFRWGQRPGRARLLVRETVRAENLRLAMRGDGTAAVLFSEGRFDVDRSDVRVAVLRRGRVPALRTLAESREPLSLDVDRGGRFVAAWADGAGGSRRLSIARVDARGRFADPASFGVDPRSLGVGPVLTAGVDQSVVWTEGGSRAVRFARRADGRAEFSAAHEIAPAGSGDLVDSTVGADGRVAVLMRKDRELRLIVRTASGRLVVARTLPGVAHAYVDRTSHARVFLEAGGGATVVHQTVVQRPPFTITARVTRLAPSGAVSTTTALPDCSIGEAALSRRGPVLLGLDCPVGKRTAGFIATVAP